MARQKNDGRGRLGGRTKGTPNKTTATVKDWLSKLLEDNRRQIEDDLKAIEPAERVRLYAALLNYVIPKQQAVTVEAAMQAEYEELTKLLKTAPDAAIDRIADRIKEIEGYNNG